MSEHDYDKQAAEVAPCHHSCGFLLDGTMVHVGPCPHKYRPAIAAALRKQAMINDAVYQGMAKETADLRAQLAAEKDRPVCDCHTWPTVAEMHDYCVALEKRLDERDKALVDWVKANGPGGWIDDLRMSVAYLREVLAEARGERLTENANGRTCLNRTFSS